MKLSAEVDLKHVGAIEGLGPKEVRHVVCL